MASRECNLEVDIESGQVSLERDDSVPISCKGKRVLTRTFSGSTNYSGGFRVQGSEESTSLMPKSGHPGCRNVAVVIDRNQGIEYRDLLDFLDKGYSKEKHLKPNSNKHFKPPCPPKGPSLNAFDMRLVKEISELAAKKKHARIERIRALKKMKTIKASSPSSSATAMVLWAPMCSCHRHFCKLNGFINSLPLLSSEFLCFCSTDDTRDRV